MNKTIILFAIVGILVLSGCSQSSQSNGDAETYEEGDIITDLTGAGEYAGQTMTIEITKISSVPTATFELHDSAGEVVFVKVFGPGTGDLRTEDITDTVYIRGFGTNSVELTIDRQ